MVRYFAAAGLVSVALLLGTAAVLPAAEAGAGLQVYTAEQVYGPFGLSPEKLQQMPAGVVPISFESPSWLIGYRTEVIDQDGVPLDKELHCHTMLMDGMGVGDTSHHHDMDAFPFKGVYSDGYTNFVRLPPGYGIPFEAGDTLDMIPMFNNRGGDGLSASMLVEAFFVLQEELETPLTPLYSTIQSVATPHLYHVAPGERDVKEKEFSMPYGGTIHAMGVHIHPYGRSIELVDVGTGLTVWEAKGEVGEDDRLVSMPFFTNSQGVPFRKGQPFLLRATYENPTDKPQDAMAGLFLFFSTADGKPPAGMAQAEGHGEGAHGADHAGH